MLFNEVHARSRRRSFMAVKFSRANKYAKRKDHAEKDCQPWGRQCLRFGRIFVVHRAPRYSKAWFCSRSLFSAAALSV